MVSCTVCGHLNEDLAVLCVSCKAYLQSKVDNLNLFETMWLLMEAPSVAFKKIALATHKNYVYVLSCALGVSLMFTAFWMWKLAPSFSNILTLLAYGGAVGVPVGIVFVLVLGWILTAVTRKLGRNVSLRNMMAVISYSSVPVLLSLVFVFPLEIAIFGIDFFGKNPSPMVINPGVYMSLLAFDMLAAGWTVLLLYRGLSVLTGLPVSRSIALTFLASILPAALVIGTSLLLHHGPE